MLESGDPVDHLEIRAPTAAAPGRDHTWLASGYPVRHDGEIVAVGIFVTDISDRVRVERELQLLFEVGEALDATLGVEERLARLAELVIPVLGDFCTIDMLEPSGEPAGRRRHAGRAEVADPARRIVVPLRARGRELGTLTLGLGPSGRAYDDGDRALALQLGRRAGLAIDNARLYDDQRLIATTLQRSLLPPALPGIAGLDVAARHRPMDMGDGVEVGGDFYDLFAAGRSWVAAIGDVCGKGIDAAALTSLARHTLRALARDDPAPGVTLERLNDAIVAERGLAPRFLTVACARVVPDGAGMAATAASAGHPLPLVVRASGRVEPLGRPGTLLGPLAEVRVHEETARLAPGRPRALHRRGHGITPGRRDVRRGAPGLAAVGRRRTRGRRDRRRGRAGRLRPPRRPAGRRPGPARAAGRAMTPRRDSAWLWYGIAGVALLAFLLLDLAGVLGGIGP